MAQYTPELLAALRRRYELTRQPVRSIARDFGLVHSTVLRIASREGWLRPPEPMRDLEPATRLLEQAIALELESDRQRGTAAHGFYSEEIPLRIPVARYTPRLLAALRRRYEQTRQPLRSIARDLDVHESTLRRIASTRRWVRPGHSWKDLEPAARVLEKAAALELQHLRRRRASNLY